MPQKTAPVGTLKRLGEMLVECGIITEEQLNESLTIQKQTKEKLGEILTRLGYITEEVLVAFLGKQLGLQFVLLEEFDEISKEALSSIPENVARRLKVFPISKENKKLTVAMCDPFNVIAIDDLKLITGCQIDVVISTEREIIKAIEKYYGDRLRGIEEVVEEITTAVEAKVEVLEEKELPEEVEISEESAPVVKLVNHILSNAINSRASDIHIEPYEKKLRLRYRIDGVLQEQPLLPKKLQNAIASRIKVMSKMDLAEHRKPQDGRIKVRIGDRDVDLRVSICPTSFGEKVVMRILDTSALCLDLDKLGFEPQTLETYLKYVKRPHGIILVTGPTGSGKSTTLYSTLRLLNHPDVNILTIEDPVEYVLEGINQVQVNPEVGLTFAQGLRSFLRQDPDIIMVGEIRDTETAEISINAALTGHLVFSTLHTNDAPTAVTRLINMGIEPFLIASTVTMVIAQRLLRVVCKHCKEAYEVNIENLVPLGVNPENFSDKTATLFRGKGCSHCSNTGYRGRTACFELMEVTNEIKELIIERASSHVIKETAIKNGMMTLREAALRKLLGGVTTIEEVMRMTAAEEEYA